MNNLSTGLAVVCQFCQLPRDGGVFIRTQFLPVAVLGSPLDSCSMQTETGSTGQNCTHVLGALPAA